MSLWQPSPDPLDGNEDEPDLSDVPPEPLCSGECLRGYDIGIESNTVAYPHPDCPKHGDGWMPYDNEWSRQYVADHPERFGSES